MITIIKNDENTVVLTLNEKMDNTSNGFIFKFINDSTSEEVIFTSNDISTAKSRYNEFIIEENINDDPVNGVITLNNSGFWSYVIYESNNPSSLTITNNKIIETGKVNVIGETIELDYYNPTEDTLYVYDDENI
jgi:hypothetical protein